MPNFLALVSNPEFYDLLVIPSAGAFRRAARRDPDRPADLHAPRANLGISQVWGADPRSTLRPNLLLDSQGLARVGELVPVRQGVERARTGLILVQHVASTVAAPGRVSLRGRLP